MARSGHRADRPADGPGTAQPPKLPEGRLAVGECRVPRCVQRWRWHIGGPVGRRERRRVGAGSQWRRRPARPPPSFATEGALFMYNWAEYIDLDNIEEFKTRYNIADWTYDIYDSNEVLLTKLQGGATGLYDIGGADRRVRQGDGRRGLSSSSCPSTASRTRQFINPTFQNFYDPAGPDAKYNKYHIPKDWGTTGIAVRKKVVTEDVKTWKQFFEVAPKYSGRIVIVESAGDVMTAPLKALGYSLNSTDPDGAR